MPLVEKAMLDGRFSLYRRIDLTPGGLPCPPIQPSPPAPQPDPPRPQVHRPTWFEVHVMDDWGDPVPEVPFAVFVDGRIQQFTSDARGCLRIDSADAASFASARMISARSAWDHLTARHENDSPPTEAWAGRPHTILPLIDSVSTPETRLQLTKHTPHTAVLRRETATVRVFVGAPDSSCGVDAERLEVFVLRSTDGAYEHTLPLRDAARTSAHHYLLEFPEISAGRSYDLECDLHGDGTYELRLFANVAYGTLIRRCREGASCHELENEAPVAEDDHEDDHPDAIAPLLLEEVA